MPQNKTSSTGFWRSRKALAPVTPWAILALLIATGCGQNQDLANKNSLRQTRSGQVPLTADAQARTSRSRMAADTTAGDTLPPESPSMEPGDACQGEYCSTNPPADDDLPTLSRELRFPAQREADGMVRHQLGSQEVAQDITLKATEVYHSLSQVQRGRASAVDEHIQGVGQNDITETFYSEADRPLDVLVVIDNGCSMAREAKNMGDKLAPLLEGIEATDWQIGVVTTDPSQTCLRALVKKGDLDPAAAFATAVAVGSNGSSNPRALLQAVRSLQGECLQQPWIRPTSNVELLFISDKDNCVNGKYCSGKDYAEPAYLQNYLSTIRTVGKNAHVNGVFMPPNVKHSDCKSGEKAGNIFAQLVQETGGAYGSICSEDYTPALAAIAKSVTTALRKDFTLARYPAAATVRVYVDGTELSKGFTVSGRIVTLDQPLDPKAKLEILYRDRVATLATRFKLRYPPVADTVVVTVDGKDAAPGSYTLDAAGPAIEFKAAPAANSRIAIGYELDMPLEYRFELGTPILAGSLEVTIDGTLTMDYKVDEATGMVDFAQAPQEGAVIVFTWKAAGAPLLRYPIVLPADQVAAFTATDKATGTPVRVTYKTGAIDLDPTEFVAGRILVIKYQDATMKPTMLTLPQEPIAGSIVATAGAVSCSMEPELIVSGRDLDFSGCGFAADAKDLVVSYRYWIAVEEFVFDVPNFPAPNDFQEWTVWVDDVETTDYTREGKSFRLKQPLVGVQYVRIRLVQRAPDPALPAM